MGYCDEKCVGVHTECLKIGSRAEEGLDESVFQAADLESKLGTRGLGLLECSLEAG